MNKYNLEISENNQQVHIDIEHDIQKQQNGLFTFILRIDNSNIVDYNVVEYADARKYLVLKKVIIEELTITPHTSDGNKQSSLRTNDSQH